MSSSSAGPSGPPKRFDPRRDYEDDDPDDCPTDDLTAPLPPAVRPKLRLDVPVTYDDTFGPTEETERIPTAALLGRGVGAAALPPHLQAWIEVTAGPAKTQRHDMTMVRMVVGRGHGADVRLPDRALSRTHITIFFNGNEFRIRDEDTKNGTLLNGSRVVEYALRDGDEVAAGRTTFVFRTGGVPGT